LSVAAKNTNVVDDTTVNLDSLSKLKGYRIADKVHNQEIPDFSDLPDDQKDHTWRSHSAHDLAS
jgi:hypothetical protein